MRSLTIRQPWAAAIAFGSKRVENRGWMTHHRGPVAIHAAVANGGRDAYEHAVEAVKKRSGAHASTILEHANVRGAVIAVARLTDVCTTARRHSYFAHLACDCGPWAQSGQVHFLLDDVQALAEPVPVKGARQVWTLPDEVEAAVRAQLSKEVAR